MHIDIPTCQAILQFLKRVQVTGLDEANALIVVARNVEMEVGYLQSQERARAAAPVPPPTDQPAVPLEGVSRQVRRQLKRAGARGKGAPAPAPAA